MKYTNGLYYIAEHENPGYDPTSAPGSGTPTPATAATPAPAAFPVSESQFNPMFPSRNPFYTYSGLIDALGAYPGFANTGDDATKKREAAAFLANVNHETGGLVYIKEINEANYPHYCDWGQPYGCPAGQAAYYGRGPIQLSWNFNYKAAGDALGIDLLGNPWQVEQNSAIAWKTGLWYWNTQTGPGTMTPHNAMVNGAGFGETIRSINGSIECNGGNPGQVQSRVDAYQRFTRTARRRPRRQPLLLVTLDQRCRWPWPSGRSGYPRVLTEAARHEDNHTKERAAGSSPSAAAGRATCQQGCSKPASRAQRRTDGCRHRARQGRSDPGLQRHPVRRSAGARVALEGSAAGEAVEPACGTR